MKNFTSLKSFLWFFSKKDKKNICLAGILCSAWSLDNSLWPIVFKKIIDTLTELEGAREQIFERVSNPLLYALALWIAVDILYRLQGNIFKNLFPNFDSNIRLYAFQYVLRYSPSFFSENLIGKISNKIFDLSRSGVSILRICFSIFSPVLFSIFLSSIFLYFVHPLFSGFLFLWSLTHLYICFKLSKKINLISSKHSEVKSQLQGKIIDSLTNYICIKSFWSYDYEYNYIEEYQKLEKQEHKKVLNTIENIKIILSVISILFVGLISLLSIYFYKVSLVSVGDIVLILTTIYNLSLMIWTAGLEFPRFYQELGICNQALKLLNSSYLISDKGNNSVGAIKEAQIEFRKVSFSYKGRSNILDEVSCIIPPKKTTAIVGLSGSGKSTFANLILRNYEINEGSILINNFDIKLMNMNSLSKIISYCPQDPLLFHRSVFENIAYGSLYKDEDAVYNVARMAQAHEFILELPDGYNTIVGEKGLKISVGQRQRIGIARAFLKNAPILIFDEATSALDAINEEKILFEINKLSLIKTVIVISHKLSTIQNADNILLFSQGKLEAAGKHKELLEVSQFYRRLWSKQEDSAATLGGESL